MRPTLSSSGARRILSYRTSSLTCQSFRRWLPSRRLMASHEKPYYITTPIFYVNAAPHVGHLSTMVLADVLKRWQVLRGKQAVLATGTDEHGLKIQQASAKAGEEPKLFCDKGAAVFEDLAARADISNDHFVRTTDPAHREAVQYAWLLLKDRGYIYASKHEGWYSISDETFYPDSAVHLTVVPSTGQKIMSSKETNKEVEWSTEINYRFKLSAFRDRLLKFYEENPQWIFPQFRMNDIVSQVKSGLEDLSISRPLSRLQWGIRVPDDDTQTIYVWLDALLNYVTKVGYPWQPGREHVGGWPADCHVIGKDITRFHCIYWPAILMALSIPLPKRILTTAHWTMNDHKMSKSIGNVVNPFLSLKRFGSDVMRYYLARDGGIATDTNYSNYYIVERYKKGLQGGLGNLASRIIKTNRWNVRKALSFRQENPNGLESLSGPAQNEGKALQTTLEGLAEAAEQHMEKFNVSGALKMIMEVVFQANRFLQAAEPWKFAQNLNGKTVVFPIDEPTLHSIVHLCAEAIRIVGILLQPWMPNKSTELLDMLCVDPQRRSIEWARPGTDDSYGRKEVLQEELPILFPRFIVDEIP